MKGRSTAPTVEKNFMMRLKKGSECKEEEEEVEEEEEKKEAKVRRGRKE